MTIVSVGKMWSRDGGSTESDGQKLTQTIREGWQVVTSADATLAEVTFAAGLPQVNQFYSGTNWIYCTRSQPTRVSPIYWTVDVEYTGDIGPGGILDPPLNTPPVIRYQAEMQTEPVDQDDWGFPTTNAAGDPVEGLTVDIPDMALYIKRNFLTWNSYLTRAYLRSVNSDYFDGWPPGTAKLKEFSADFIVDKSLGYWAINAKIVFREPWNTTAARTWWKRYQNKGMNVIAGTKVTFSKEAAATCKRAMGYPVIDENGVITAICMTNWGSGYTSYPTVTITSSTGSGATAAATIGTAYPAGAGEVNSITVTNGGSDYKLGKFLAVDDRKQPVTEPVMLDYDGSQLKNTQLTTWIERPVGVFPLPYNALGLI